MVLWSIISDECRRRSQAVPPDVFQRKCRAGILHVFDVTGRGPWQGVHGNVLRACSLVMVVVLGSVLCLLR
jgi:hypothetical protein